MLPSVTKLDPWLIVWVGSSGRGEQAVRRPRPLQGADTRPMKFETSDAATQYLVEMTITESHDPEFVEELKVMRTSTAEEFGVDLS